MPDYRKMTVESLRELARKVLGPGHSKRTKLELVSMLEGAGKGDTPEAAPAARKAPARPAAKAARAVPGAKAEKPQKAAKATKPAPRGASPAAKAGKPAPKAEKPARSGKAATPAKAAERPAARSKAAPRGGAAKAARGRTTPAVEAEADPPEADAAPGSEGYFVARVRGEEAVREAPRALTEGDTPTPRETPPSAEEGLGELPWGYGDDTFMALPRDPRTLFLFWDFSSETTREAFAGVEGGRAELRVYARAGAGWEEVRRIDFALESRGFYVHDLDPGRVYRAEIHAVGRAGVDRTLGAPTNDMMLPPLGPSPVIDDRFIRIPWDMPLGRLLGPGHAGGPFSDEARALLARLSDWSRFGGGGGSSGGVGGGARGPGAGGLGSGSGSGAGPLGGGSGAGRGL